MLLGFILFLTALAVLLGMTANYGRQHLTSSATPATPYENTAAQLPWLKVLLIAAPFYFGAMYWTKVIYGPVLTGLDLAGLTTRREVLRRPYLPLLDSKIAALAPDYFFEDAADTGAEKRSDVLIYEDGKLLGPAHTSLYEVAVLGRGRYAHWKGNYSVFAFSSSDNTDPNTNGRVYIAERPLRR